MPIYLTLLIGVMNVGSLCTGEEVIILDNRKVDTLLDWDKRALSEGSRWQVVHDAGDQVIKLRSDSSSLSLEKSILVDLKQTPYLEWEWKVTILPKEGTFTAAESDAQAAQLLVTFSKRLFD